MVRPGRTRLDELLVERKMAPSRSAARGLIMAGLVTVSGRQIDKAGTGVEHDAAISIKERPRFVSRGGDKLAHALAELKVTVERVSALDVGASTGGFVDCLLQHGACRVTAVDVGRGQLDHRLLTDDRVTVIDRVNARYLAKTQLPYEPDLLTMDVSFISITKVLPAVAACMAASFEGLVLVKPQFEAGPGLVGKGGIVRDPEVHRAVLRERARFVTQELGLDLVGMCASKLRGADGNREFFFHVARARENGFGLDRLDEVADDIVRGEDPAASKADT